MLNYCHLLLEEACSQPYHDVPDNLIAALHDQPDSITACINLLNECRSYQHWPLVSGMTCLDVTLGDMLADEEDVDLIIPRAILQESLIALFKKKNNAIHQVCVALNYLHRLLHEDRLGLMASGLSLLLENIDQFEYHQAIFDCLKHYDLLLKEYSNKTLHLEAAEKLWVNISFYHQQLNQQEPRWSMDESIKQHLNLRIQYFAYKLADLLKVPDGDATLLKEKIMPYYLAITDGLLFGEHFELRARMEARFKKLDQLDDPMLLIAIPAQKLWAECLRIAVNV